MWDFFFEIAYCYLHYFLLLNTRYEDEPTAGNNQRNFKRHRVNAIEVDEYDVYNINDSDDKLRCSIGGITIEMVIDSGSKFNLIDESTWKLMLADGLEMKNQRMSNNIKFRAYGKYPLKLTSIFDAEIVVQDSGNVLKEIATFYVIEKGQQPLLGKETAMKMGLLLVGLPSMHTTQVRNITTRGIQFPKIKDVKVRLPIDENVRPVRQPVRRVPLAHLSTVKEKLDEMLSQSIIEKVEEPSEWISPMVPVFKDNGEVRICIDMRRANTAIKRAEYPLPTIDEMLPLFSNAKYFTTLDIKQAFFQCELHEDSRPITTFNTPWGRYRFNRLMFGVNCAPEIFQRTLENMLLGLDNVINFIDDILVWGDSEESHDKSLKKVLEKLRLNGVLLNSHKCKYKVTEVKFLGYKLSGEGIEPSDEKISAIQRFRTPSTREEVRSFLGLVTYVGRFIPDLATINEPLRRLTKSEVKFTWQNEQQSAFDAIKGIMSNAQTLSYFDKNMETRLIADASPVGVGCVLIQFNKAKTPKVIGYAAKSLTDVEKRYCQTEREALALVWSVERFSHYLLGSIFELETDHKALECLFTERSRPCARI